MPLGAEKRIKQFLQVLFRDAAAAILNPDVEVVFNVTDSGPDQQPPAVRHRLTGVNHDIDENLLNLGCIHHNLRQIRLIFPNYLNLLKINIVFDQGDRPVNGFTYRPQLFPGI